MAEFDIQVDGRTVHVYDNGPTDGYPLFWHPGTPGTGATPPPLLGPNIRVISHDRPGYAGSSRQPGRTVASVVQDVAAIADTLHITDFATIGASGGGPHALACAALLPDRVRAVIAIASLVPPAADGLNWYDGMHPSGVAELEAAASGQEALRAYLSSAQFDPEIFVPADHAALAGPMAWLSEDVGAAMQGGLDGMVDDDVALVAPWGCTPQQVTAKVLVMHGDADRMVPATHGKWLAARCPNAQLKLFPGDGHISVLTHIDVALDWLGEQGSR